jgi:threonine synthase
MTVPDAPGVAQAGLAGHPGLLNEAARIACILCGATASTEQPFWGCQVCGQQAPLAVEYPGIPADTLGPTAAAARARNAYWLFADLADGKSVGAPTPLTPAPGLGSRVYLKHETFSLTHSHKDRYQAVAARMALLSGCRGVVASSTGNHGASAAAHATAAGLPSVVFCHRDAPEGLLRAIGAFGGIVAQVPEEEQRAALTDLVRDGWFPATTLDPILSGAANPYAAEGYKTVAWEMVEQLGALPDAVFIPTAGGDTYYGIAKGLAEVARLAGQEQPRVYAVQPASANALSRSLAAGRQVVLEAPASIALSIADAQSGRHALAALAAWNGSVLDVSEAAIRRAIADLARAGVYTDPASAAALAGYRLAVADGVVDVGETSVLLLTSSGFKWPAAMEAVFPVRSARSRDELWRELAARRDA